MFYIQKLAMFHIMSRTDIQVFSKNSLLNMTFGQIRTNGYIFRINPIIFKTHAVIFKTNEVT